MHATRFCAPLAPLAPFAPLLLVTALAAQQQGFWEDRPRLAQARQEVGAAVVNGIVYVAGGLDLGRQSIATVEQLDPAVGAWRPAPAMPTPRHHFGMAAVNGRLYVVGGYVSGFVADDQVFEFDPATGQWRPRARLPAPRGALAAVEIGGLIYAVGGVTGRVVGDLAVYDPAADVWRTLAPMPTAREHLAAAAINGKLYVAGGRLGSTLFKVLEVYDPATNTWRRLADMPTARGGNGAAVLGEKLIVVGGEGPGGNFKETEEYDPVTGQWRSLLPMSTPLHGIYPVTVGDEILVAGGGLTPGFAAGDTVIAFRRLPDGVERFGAPTPACGGAGALLEINLVPRAGTAGFAFSSAAGAPPSTPGALLVGAGRHVAGVPLLGARIHVDLARPFIGLGLVTSPARASALGVPLPPASAGVRIAAQLVFVNTAGCGGAGSLSASDALDVRIR